MPGKIVISSVSFLTQIVSVIHLVDSSKDPITKFASFMRANKNYPTLIDA